MWTTGKCNDSNTGTSFSDAICTDTRAAALMSAGDTLYVGAGTYSSGFTVSSFDKGTSGGYTIIKGTCPLGVSGGVIVGPTITQTTSLLLSGNNNNYLQFENIIWRYADAKGVEGHFVKFIRCGFLGGPPTGQDPKNFTFGTSDFQPSTNALFEDCVFVSSSTGSGRYQLLLYQTEKVVTRRNLMGTNDGWSDGGSNPSAVLTNYNSSTNTHQNNVVLDIDDFPTSTGGQWGGAYYNVTNTGQDHNAGFNQWIGNIAFNVNGPGFYTDGNLSDSSCTIVDMAFVDIQDWGMALGNGSGSHSYRIDGVTIHIASRSSAGVTGIGKFDAGGTESLKNLILSNLGTDDLNGVSATYFDTYNNGETATGTGQQTYNPRANGLTWYVYIDTGSNLATQGSGRAIGANIRNKLGADGTMWGETGWNSDTGESLWPFPYEDEKKVVFCSASDGFGMCGTNYTVTEWVLGYGVAPGGLYDADSSSPTAPTNVSTTAVTGTSFAFGWTQGTDAVGVTDVRLDVDDNSNFASPLAGYSDLSLGVVTSTSVTGLSPATTYYFILRNKDAAGNTSANSSTQSAVTATLDISSPTAPGVPMASSTGTSSFNWTWAAATDNLAVTGYKFTLDDDSGFGSPVSGYNDLDVGNTLSQATINLIPGTIYYARVRAYDAQGNVGDYSTSGTGTTAFTPVPPRGFGLGTGRIRTFPKNSSIRIPK
jgi:hypothetical protein